MSEKEQAAFTAPADSSLTVEQVDQYLRTTLAQLELIGAEMPAVRERLATAKRERAESPPSTPKAARPRTPQTLWSEFVNGAFVRSARKLGYRPAELVYVRGRFSVASGHLLAAEMHELEDEGAALMRQQAEMMRGTPAVTQAQIEIMLQAAARAEQPRKAPPTPPRVAQNLGALRQAHVGLSDDAWGRIAGVAAGIGLSDLAQLPEAESSRKLDELRQVHLLALENRTRAR